MIILSQSIRTMQNCYMDTGSFIIHIKIEDAYKYIGNDVEKRSDTSNYEINRLLLKVKKSDCANEMWIR